MIPEITKSVVRYLRDETPIGRDITDWEILFNGIVAAFDRTQPVYMVYNEKRMRLMAQAWIESNDI